MTTSGDVVNVAAFGDMDLSTTATVEQRALNALTTHSPSILIVDLRGVPFMDSIGLGLLLTLHQSASHRGCRLVVVRGPDDVQRVLDITGLTAVLDFVGDPVEVMPNVDA